MRQAARKKTTGSKYNPLGKQKVHSTRQTKKNGPEFFNLTALVNNQPIKFIIDSGSPVTLIPKSQLNRITPMMPIGTEYRDVNDNRIKFEGKQLHQ